MGYPRPSPLDDPWGGPLGFRAQLVAGLWLDQGADLEFAVDVGTRLG